MDWIAWQAHKCLERIHSSDRPNEYHRLLQIFVRTFGRDFVLAWAVRGGVGLLPHLLKLLRNKGFDLVEALRLSFGRSAFRFGLFMALYFALFKILERLLQRYRRKRDSWNAFGAGGVAALALLVEEAETRWMIAQYLAVRAIGTSVSKMLLKYPRLGRWLIHGDAAVFAACSGQAVYNFVVRPETLDPAYSHFLTQVTQMDPLVIRLFQGKMRTGQLSPPLLAQLAEQWQRKGYDLTPLGIPDRLTCAWIHPERGCLSRILWLLLANFRMVFPMYFSLHLVPALLAKKDSLRQLQQILRGALKNGGQSSGFMALYVAIFQVLLCIQRNLMQAGILRGEWKPAFWLMGFLSAASIFVEKKSRRSELALYVSHGGEGTGSGPTNRV